MLDKDLGHLWQNSFRLNDQDNDSNDDEHDHDSEPVIVPATTDEDTAIVFNFIHELREVDDDLMLASIEDLPGGGTLTQISGTHVSFDPDGDFDYLASGESTTVVFIGLAGDQNEGGWEDLVEVRFEIVVTGVNDAPLAHPDSASTDEDTAISIDVLGNDSDPDAGDALTLVGLSGATSAEGAEIRIENGQIVYDPSGSAALQALGEGESATDTFTYTVQDSQGATSTNTVTVSVDGAGELLLLDFEDISVAGDHAANLPRNYGGLSWSKFALVMETDEQSGAGYKNASVSGDNIVFNSFAKPIAVWKEEAFDLESLYLTAAWNNNLNVRLQGFLNGVKVGEQRFVIDPSATLIQPDDSIFDNVDRFTLASSGGVNAGLGGGGTQLAFDELTLFT